MTLSFILVGLPKAEITNAERNLLLGAVIMRLIGLNSTDLLSGKVLSRAN